MTQETGTRPARWRRGPGWVLPALLWFLLLLAGAAVLWLVALALTSLIVLTTAVLAALLLSALLNPLVARLVRLQVPRWLAALLALLVTTAGLVGFGFLLVDRVVSQSGDLGSALRQSGEKLRSLVLDSPLPISGKELDQLPENVLEGLRQALPTAATGAGIAANILTAVALTLFLWFFMMKDGSLGWRWFLSWIPRRRRSTVDQVGARAWDVLTRYVRGTVVIAFADAVGAGVVMAFLGVPLTMSLSLLVFLGAFVPIVGSTIAGAVAVAVTLVTVGAPQALILLAAVIVVQQLEGNLLQPLVMGRALHLHPAVIVVAVTAGTILAGVLGALVAVPVVAIVYRVADDLVRGGDDPAAAEPDANDGDDADASTGAGAGADADAGAGAGAGD